MKRFHGSNKTYRAPAPPPRGPRASAPPSPLAGISDDLAAPTTCIRPKTSAIAGVTGRCGGGGLSADETVGGGPPAARALAAPAQRNGTRTALGARLVGSAWAQRAARRAAGWVAALRYAANKPRIARIFGDAWRAAPPTAVRFNPRCTSPTCAAHVEAVAKQMRICVQGDTLAVAGAFRPTATVMDLTAFPSAKAYVDFVAKTTGGRYRRSANKAKRLGYSVRRIANAAFASGVRKIMRSALWRSHGPVLDGFAAAGADARDDDPPPLEPACPEHWVESWGAFGPVEGEHGLAGRATLRRAGDVIAFDYFMGHASVLKDGVMKLLMFDLMTALLARKEARYVGIQTIFQGYADSGAKGILDWKRYVGFAPRRLALLDDRPFAFPPDFDDATYLRLNPDVARVGADARTHYILFGALEGRPYRDAP